MASVLTLISFMGGGKTYFTKDFCLKNKMKNYIYDVNDEYKTFPNSAIENDFEKFLQTAEKLNHTNIIFEDATGEINGKVEKELKRMIIAKRHTKNNFIFLFHSIEDTPPFILRMTEYIVLFKTGDIEETCKRKAPILLQPFNKLRSMPYLFNAKENKKYSPKLIIKKIG